MPRPRKCRRVCHIPQRVHFGPLDSDMAETEAAHVVMSVDELESIRLIDLEGLTQEECAGCMNVARTTAQAIYNRARKKLASCLVYGMQLQIHGGDYTFCPSPAADCTCPRCPRVRARQTEQEERHMILAIPYENEEVFAHFGKSPAFKLYELKGREITGSRIVSTDGNGHGALVGMLKTLGVSALVCGGIGDGARQALAAQNIAVYGGIGGNADRAAADYAAGTLAANTETSCGHPHSHEDGHTCGHGGGACGGHHH